ncbi:MAG: hypothetical protein OXF27_21190 [Acidobacteria bacterium]|nr:hypothetical protein [Acidobacteriota bacterium]
MQTVRAEFPLDPEFDLNGTWQRLRDLSRAHLYVPGLTAVSFVGAQREGVGTHRRVRIRGILTMDETVTEWREGAGMTLRLNRGDKGPLPPLREHFFDYGLSERDGRVWLVNRMRYEVGLGPLGTLLDRLLLHREIGRQLRDITLAQKIFYETGRKVTPAMLRAAKSRLSARE